MLHVFYYDVYVLLNPRLHLFYMTLLTKANFGICPEKLSKPFLVSTPVGESIIAKQVYKKCPITVLHRVMFADLIELDMVDFDIILGIDWLHPWYASLDC